VCLKVGLLLAGEDLSGVRQTLQEWSNTARRVRVDWDDQPVLADFGQALPADQQHLSLYLGDRETGCSCGLATDTQPEGWKRSAMSDLSFLLMQLSHHPFRSLRLGIAWEGEEAELERVELSLPRLRKRVKQGALGRNHLYSVQMA
jgi:hypothetical protein